MEESENGCAVWDFRANEDYYESEEVIIKFLTANCKKWVFQLEKSDTGYIHWQGRFSLIKKRHKNKLLDLFEASQIQKPNHISPTVKENHKEEFFYAMKEDTRLRGFWSDKTNKQEQQVYIPRQLRNLELHPFQHQILDSAHLFEGRNINLIYDTKGCIGKSTVASLGELLHGGIDMPPLNDFKELIAVACNICMTKQTRTPKIMFFDMPRAIDKTRLYGMYSAIEQVKKGKLFDIRYNYKCWWIDSPQIWVFTNHLPDTKLLSQDRWKIWTINDDKLLQKYNPDDGEVNNIISSLDS